jgi:hypothetical protein
MERRLELGFQISGLENRNSGIRRNDDGSLIQFKIKVYL